MNESLWKQTLAVATAFGIRETLRRSKRYLNLKRQGPSAYHAGTVRWLADHARTHPTFIDIGAAEGHIAVPCAPAFLNVLAIEPEPGHAATLRRRAQQHPNVRVLELALGKQPGEGFLGRNPDNPDDSALALRPELSNRTPVRVETLDRVLEGLGLRAPFAVKIDVQGGELDVFRGASRLLTEGCVVLSEVWPRGLRAAGETAESYVSWMNERGYRAFEPTGRPVAIHQVRRWDRIGAKHPSLATDVAFRRA